MKIFLYAVVLSCSAVSSYAAPGWKMVTEDAYYDPATIKTTGSLKTITMLSNKYALDSKVKSAVFDVEVNCAEKKYRVPGQTKAYSEKYAGGKLLIEFDRPKDWVAFLPTAPMAFICK